MNTSSAKPNLLKQVNLSQIRKVLATHKSVTRSEITKITGISSTTVRSLLHEMLEHGDVQRIGYDVSSGGRKAERYALQPNGYWAIAFCCRNESVHALVVNSCGEVVETAELTVNNEPYENAMIPFLDAWTQTHAIKSIGVGVPGIVQGGSYQQKHIDREEFYTIAIGDHLAARYGVPVVLENDLNAIAIGFGLCYEKMFPQEHPHGTNMAYLHFEKTCVSAGFLTNGRIVRGQNCFAGELGLVPVKNGKLLDELMQETMDDETYIERVVRILGWVCGILNPEYIALGGPHLREHCIGDISDALFGLLPKNMFAELLYAPELWADYHEGMAHLAAEKMFETVRLVQE